ncbi:polysaccharide lyase family 7 protein [Aquimarina sp. 2201CG14-23]|uniref:polysaccharide lyase family 7 protein n=1 Tax=Aquimarina mycalae TaxID=3040073 RepID=UPI002477CC61|nr:polysaccharide lyase family 7 protein [Aquimarina sp. 2201CG14-23]MDH7445802.1 polysaccharide lyase family 7 protein [Aquimarina sp. 2201CG14-23]
MKKLPTVKKKLSFLSLTVTFMLILLFSALSCTNEQIEDEILEGIKEDTGIKISVPIQNPGFESGKANWGSTSNYAISGDEHSGSKAAKVTGSSGKIEQTVSVNQNTNYILKAWVKGNGKLSISGQTNDFNTSNFEEVSVSFNSGSSSSVTIVGTRDSGDVRFDDFTLNSESEGTTGSGQIIAQNVSTNGNQTGYGPENTVDGEIQNTESRWSSNGYTGKYITYDLGTTKTISSLKIAWFKGDERKAYFKIRVGNSTSSLSTIYDAKTNGSSGTTEGLETYDFDSVNARYVRISCFGNSSSSWNSIIETEIYGEGTNPGDTTPPGAVSNLRANAGNGSVSLSWDNPNDADFSNVSITYTGGSTTATGENKTISGLTNGTSYTFTVVAKDDSGNTSSSKSVTATPQGNTRGGNNPSDILSGLDKWKITFPLDGNGKDSTNDNRSGNDCNDRNRNASDSEIEMGDLIGEIPMPYAEYFYVEGDEVVFKAHCGGATTSGSSYPRSELRQMPGGNDNYWSMNDYQYLDVRVRATHLPVEKPEVSMVQIHGPGDEPLRVEYRSDEQGLHVVQNDDIEVDNVLPYSLGEQLRVTVTVQNGRVYCRIENESRPGLDAWTDDWESADSTGYFKVGCYTQSTMFLEDCKSGEGYDNESPNAYGEVRVKDMTLDVTY